MIKFSYNLVSRNDDYYKDNIDILSKTINTNLFFLDKIDKKDSVEFNIIDWGSEKPLNNHVKIYKDYEKNVNFFYVSKKDADVLSESYPNKFNLNIPVNLAVRISKGEFVIQGTSDQIFSRVGWLNLFNIVENKKKFKFDVDNTIFYVPRKILEFDFYKKKPSIDILEDFLDYHNSSYMYSKNSSFFIGGGYSLLCNKNMIEKMGGINNEKNSPNSGNDADLNIRLTRLGINQIDTNSFGVFFYKFPSDVKSIRNKLLKSKLTRQPPSIPLDNFPNDDDWGMKQYNIETHSPKKLINDIDINIEEYFNLENRDLSFSNMISILSKFENISFNIQEWKLIFQIINIIKSNRIFGLIEIGFDNVNRLVSIGQQEKSTQILTMDTESKFSEYYYVNRLRKVQDVLSRNRYGKFIALNSDNFNELNNNFDQIKFHKWSNLILVNTSSIKSKDISNNIENLIKDKVSSLSYVIFWNKFKNVSSIPNIDNNFKNIYNDKKFKIYINKSINLKNSKENSNIKSLNYFNIFNLIIVYSIFSIYNLTSSMLKKIHKKIFRFKY